MAPDPGPAQWNWEDPDQLAPLMDGFTEGLARCEKLEPVPLAAPYRRQDLAELGVTGIEFAAWKSAHPAGLGTDVVPLRGANGQTEPGQLVRVDGERYFAQLDISDPLPFAAASVDWVYAEHLIEHVPLPVAVGWLTEVRRVLAPGGVLRVTTPDLRRYVEGYLGDGRFFAGHRRRLHAAGVGPPMPTRPAFMFNQLFYLYGHRWIYDLEELRYVLAEAGFDAAGVRGCAFREGARPDVADLDRVLRKDETMYVEVTG
jgi:predicted SAM-dependent methyltransferase